MKPLTLMILPLFLLLAACRTPAGTATPTAPTPHPPGRAGHCHHRPSPTPRRQHPGRGRTSHPGHLLPRPRFRPLARHPAAAHAGQPAPGLGRHRPAPALNQAGYAVLAIDLRGHGQTGGSIDWPQVDDDLPRVWAYLTGRDDVDPARTAIIGASIGANLALRTAANLPQVRGVVLLSPASTTAASPPPMPSTAMAPGHCSSSPARRTAPPPVPAACSPISPQARPGSSFTTAPAMAPICSPPGRSFPPRSPAGSTAC